MDVLGTLIVAWGIPIVVLWTLLVGQEISMVFLGELTGSIASPGGVNFWIPTVRH